MKGNHPHGASVPLIADVAAVSLRHGMPLDSALKILKRKVARAQILRELRDRETFRSSSARKRLKSHRARTRDARAAAKRLRAFTERSEATEKPRAGEDA
jgi:ribosomal protein S21